MVRYILCLVKDANSKCHVLGFPKEKHRAGMAQSVAMPLYTD